MVLSFRATLFLANAQTQNANNNNVVKNQTSKMSFNSVYTSSQAGDRLTRKADTRFISNKESSLTKN
jgi:hypothetical protein